MARAFGTTADRTLPYQIEQVMGDWEKWARKCHQASLHLVKSGVLGQGGLVRVARGTCKGVGGQHSWAVVGNPFEPDLIVDVTRWSYEPGRSHIVIETDMTSKSGRHYRPHGAGSIFAWGCPPPATGPVIELTPQKPFSDAAQGFLDLCGPLDSRGWAVLAHAPLERWPAGEILTAMYQTEALPKALIPVDALGMVTELNPGGLYW